MSTVKTAHQNRMFYASWFFFLQQAIKAGIEVNSDAYREWGTLKELRSITFYRWWSTRGEQIARRHTETLAKVLDVNSSGVTIHFPFSLNSRQVKAAASALVTKSRESAQVKVRAQTKGFDYKQFKLFEKVLELELDMKSDGLTYAKKAALLSDLFKKRSEVNKKALGTYRQRATDFETLWKRDGKAIDRKTMEMYRRRAASLSEFIRQRESEWGTTEQNELVGADSAMVKKMWRWGAQAKMLMLNAAEGQFVGEGWYGERIGEQLKVKEGKFSKKAASVKRNAGGNNAVQQFRRKL
jgi:stalled ribosome alternative rescue factor ArfA